MAGAIRFGGERSDTMIATPLLAQEIAIEREVPPAPLPPEPEPPPLPPEPPKWVMNVPTPPAPSPSEQPEELPQEPPSSEAAQAGEVLVRDSDDEQEEDDDDADDNTFVTGDAGAYAGGTTTSGGTSALAVRGSVVTHGGVPGGSGTQAVAEKSPERDLSRPAWLDGSTSWDDCDFPGEAERDHVRNALVEMTVTVRPNGTVHSVDIVEDPGHGFARTASACALKHKFAPAHDREGHNVWGTTRPFHVGFHR